MSYPDDAEYPYVDLAELADTYHTAAETVERTGMLPYPIPYPMCPVCGGDDPRCEVTCYYDEE